MNFLQSIDLLWNWLYVNIIEFTTIIWKKGYQRYQNKFSKHNSMKAKLYTYTSIRYFQQYFMKSNKDQEVEIISELFSTPIENLESSNLPLDTKSIGKLTINDSFNDLKILIQKKSTEMNLKLKMEQLLAEEKVVESSMNKSMVINSALVQAFLYNTNEQISDFISNEETTELGLHKMMTREHVALDATRGIKRMYPAGREAECDVIKYNDLLKSHTHQWNVSHQIDEDEWKDCLCHGVEGLKDRHHYKKYFVSNGGLASNIKTIIKELQTELPEQLISNAKHSMFVRYDSEHPQYVQAALTGMEGSPYSNGVFLFDIYLPTNYPDVPLECNHVTPGGRDVHASHGPGGFSPNLHRESGKVCLSLLGTWSGPGWKKGESNIYQVLSTIELVILSYDYPYYLEPSYGGWEGNAPKLESDPKKEAVLQYNDTIQYHTALHCIKNPLKNPPIGFESVVESHFKIKRKIVLEGLKSWIHDSAVPNGMVVTDLPVILSEIQDLFNTKLSKQDIQDDIVERFDDMKYISNRVTQLTLKMELIQLLKVKFSTSTTSSSSSSSSGDESEISYSSSSNTDSLFSALQVMEDSVVSKINIGEGLLTSHKKELKEIYKSLFEMRK